jgi:predicted DNA-binding protein (UPF0251 family)
MYRWTYDKIETNAAYLKKIHAKGNIENLHLFDEPYKLALKLWDYGDLEDNLVAKELGINKQTVMQVRSALGVN